MDAQKKYRNIILASLIISWTLITIALMADVSNQASVYLLIFGIVLAAISLILYIIQEFNKNQD